jgi:hypothetical protein
VKLARLTSLEHFNRNVFSTEVSLCVCLCVCTRELQKERGETEREESTMYRNVNIVLQFGYALHVVIAGDLRYESCLQIADVRSIFYTC